MVANMFALCLIAAALGWVGYLFVKDYLREKNSNKHEFMLSTLPPDEMVKGESGQVLATSEEKAGWIDLSKSKDYSTYHYEYKFEVPKEKSKKKTKSKNKKKENKDSKSDQQFLQQFNKPKKSKKSKKSK